MEQSPEIKHFIVTRFNLINPLWSSEKVISEEWLRERIRIFETFCYPSVVNQTCKNFKWLIFFDINTPISIKDYIEKNYLNAQTEIFYIDGFNALNLACKDIVRSCLKENEYFISSRLDNDDALHKDYVKTIQNLSKHKTKTIIDLAKGYQFYYTEEKTIAKELSYRYNPFISLISNFSELELVIEKEHFHWNSKNYNYIHCKKNYFWIQFIHNNNQLNTIIKPLKTTNINLIDFGIIHLNTAKISFYDKTINALNIPFRNWFYIKSWARLFKQRFLR